MWPLQHLPGFPLLRRGSPLLGLLSSSSSGPLRGVALLQGFEGPWSGEVEPPCFLPGGRLPGLCKLPRAHVHLQLPASETQTLRPRAWPASSTGTLPPEMQSRPQRHWARGAHFGAVPSPEVQPAGSQLLSKGRLGNEAPPGLGELPAVPLTRGHL